MTERLNSKYVIERPLGRGGMGEVFAGRSFGLEGFSHPVAIKRLPAQFRDDHTRRSMLITEACLTARLVHANIVAVHDLDQDEAGQLFLVMELVAGTDLASLLRTGALPLPVVLFVACEILRGLSHAHSLPNSTDSVCGLVHRDVSPQNVLIGWDGAVKVSDFGLAKARAGTKASASLLIKGKLAYMSPEQADNLPLDGRSDLFSLGIVLWEMICSERLFDHDTLHAIARSLLIEPIPSPRSRVPDLPQDIERITMRFLERAPSCRYATADAAIDALLACAAYPKNGRELLSALLRERLPSPSVSLSEETTSVPTIAPRVRQEPYPDPPVAGRARRLAILASLTAAMALVTLLALRSVLRDDDGDAPAPQVTRVAPPVGTSIAPPSSRPPATEITSAPLQPSTSPVSLVPLAPTVAPPPSRVPSVRHPAKRTPTSAASATAASESAAPAPATPVPAAPASAAPASASKPDDEIRVIDLREVRDWAPLGGENRSPHQ
jgi:serine/threonine-protein kinase